MSDSERPRSSSIDRSSLRHSVSQSLRQSVSQSATHSLSASPLTHAQSHSQSLPQLLRPLTVTVSLSLTVTYSLSLIHCHSVTHCHSLKSMVPFFAHSLTHSLTHAAAFVDHSFIHPSIVHCPIDCPLSTECTIHTVHRSHFHEELSRPSRSLIGCPVLYVSMHLLYVLIHFIPSAGRSPRTQRRRSLLVAGDAADIRTTITITIVFAHFPACSDDVALLPSLFLSHAFHSRYSRSFCYHRLDLCHRLID